MKCPSYLTARPSGLDIRMTPMIDVVFLLLIFFVWAASTQTIEYLLQGRQEQTAGSQTNSTEPPLEVEDFDRVTIQIVWNNEQPGWIVNGVARHQLADVVRLLKVLAENKDATTETPVIIDPTGEVPLGDVIDVWDAALLAGFHAKEVRFTAKAP